MSQAAIERGLQPSGLEANIVNAREVFAGMRRQEYFKSLPGLVLAQGTLSQTETPFIGSAVKSALGLGISGIKNLAERVTNRPFKPIFTTDLSGDKAYPPSEADIDSLKGNWEPNRAWRMAGLLAGGAATVVACTPTQTAEVRPASPSEATAAPVVGGPNPIATFEPNSEYGKELNPIIDAFNAGQKVDQADLNKINEAKAAEAAQKPPPEAPNTPEDIEKTILVPKDFRSSAELLQRKGTNSLVLGFKLKEETSLPAAFPEGILPDGEIRKSEAPAPYNGLHLQIINPKNPTAPRITLIGDIVTETMLNENAKDVKTIGKIGNTGATNIDGYNLIITITKQTQPGQFSTDVDTIKRYFPEAYSKGSKEFVMAAGTSPSHAINDTFN